MHRMLLVVSAVSIFCPFAAVAQIVTPGVDFNTDASLDDDADSRWQDTTQGPTGFDFELDTGNGVSRITGASALPGITAAYDFPGGFTGNLGGALLSNAGTGTRRSFANASGDWTNENVSVELWFKPSTLTPSPTNGQILFEDGGGNGLGFFLDNNEIRLRTESGGGNVAYNLNTDSLNLLTGPATSEFVQVVGTFDRGPNPDGIELFVNGVSVGTGTTGNQNDWSGGDPAATATRGGANTGGISSGQSNTESFDGQIAIFRTYRDQVLSASQVADNYNAVVNSAPAFTLPETMLEYDAAKDDGLNSTWENTGTVSGRDANLSGETYVANPSTSLPGITAAYDFDGSDTPSPGSGGTVGSLNNLRNGQDVSFEAWIRPSDLTGDEVIFETGGINGVGIFLGGGTNAEFMGVTDSQLTFSVADNFPNAAYATTDLAGIGVDEFIHVLGTFDISANEAALYINGVLEDTDIAGSSISDWSGGDGAGLGLIGGSNMGGIGNGNQGFTNFEGEIAIFNVLDRAIGADEALRRFNAIATSAIVPEPTSIAIWSLIGLGFAGFGYYRVRRKK